MSDKFTIFLRNYQMYTGSLLCLVAAIYCMRQAVSAWRDAIHLDQEERSFANRFLAPLASRLAPRTEIAVRESRLWLARAGWRDEGAMARYQSFRVISLMFAALAYALYLTFGLSAFYNLVGFVLIGYIGIMAPSIRIDGMVRARQDKIDSGMSSLMDLMVLCLDVGLSVEAAFGRVTFEMRSLEPLMAEESQVVVSEMSAGLTFPQALKRMADRIGLEELMTLSKLISQAALLGASIAVTLREYSDASQEKRLLKLDEKAGKISSMLVLPITLCMLPATLIAIAGPSIILLANVFGSI